MDTANHHYTDSEVMEKMVVDIIADTPDYTAFNKPAGLVVEAHPKYPSLEGYAHYLFSKKTKNPYTGIVHRLDRPVSGTIIVAKKKSILKFFSLQFRNRRVKKTYLAITQGPPPAKAGTIYHWLEKDTARRKAILYENKKGCAVECKLHYRQLAAHEGLHLIELHPFTGRYHQLRAQLQFMGCPILGDKKYGSQKTYLKDGIALHALRLAIPTPASQGLEYFEAPVPDNEYFNFFSAFFKNR